VQLTFGPHKESAADVALRRVYDAFSIEYVLRPRAGAPAGPTQNTGHGSLTSALLGAVLNPAAGASQGMPCLTPRGFSDLCQINALSDPPKSWAEFNRILQHYRLPIWQQRGDVPREMLPAVAAPHMLSRIANVQASQLQASHAAVQATYQASLLRAKGQRAALDLIGPPTEYEYRYRDDRI